MRIAAALLGAATLAGCGALITQDGPPPPAPSVEEARNLLDEVIDAGIARDFERLCSMASGTCEGELEGFKERAPTESPRVVEWEVHEPTGNGESWTSGGVLFLLCGTDALGDAYESEVLVFDDGRQQLLATAAVYWVGTRVGFAVPGEDGVSVGAEPDPEPSRC